MRHLIPFVVAIAIVAAACEPSSSSGPTAPSFGAATVSGTIAAGSGTGTGVSSTGATVRAVGSQRMTVVDVDQAFTLPDVPVGSNVVLQITGAGLDSQVPIGAVAAGERVVLVLVRTGSALELDHTGRQNEDGSNIQGRIDVIPSANSFVVIGQLIVADGTTQIFRGDGSLGSFADLAIGVRVDVAVGGRSTNTVTARTVRIMPAPPDTTVRLQGAISEFSGTSLDFQFTVQGRFVRGNSATSLAPGTVFTVLANGAEVEVTGVSRPGFVQATLIQLR
jgi:hypothetical protein